MIIWPLTLPQGVALDGFGTTYEGAFSTFKPEVGKPIRRSTSTRAFEMLQCTLFLTNSQYPIFWTFWRVDLRRGILNFTFPHPILDIPVDVEFAGEDPPTTTIRAGSYDKWQAQFVLRVLDET